MYIRITTIIITKCRYKFTSRKSIPRSSHVIYVLLLFFLSFIYLLHHSFMWIVWLFIVVGHLSFISAWHSSTWLLMFIIFNHFCFIFCCCSCCYSNIESVVALFFVIYKPFVMNVTYISKIKPRLTLVLFLQNLLLICYLFVSIKSVRLNYYIWIFENVYCPIILFIFFLNFFNQKKNVIMNKIGFVLFFLFICFKLFA